MTDKLNPISSAARKTRSSRRKRSRDATNAAATADPPNAAPLNPGPGRARCLDPDQSTLDESIRRIYGAGGIQATLDETAALLGVSLDTLGEFFLRYPTVKEKFDDLRHSGIASIRAQLFKNMPRDPETVRWMAERFAGVQDPYKLRDIDQRARAFAQRQEEFEQTMELRKQELDQRERELVIKEQEHGLRIQDFGPGAPIDIKSLSTKQLEHLRERLVAGRIARQGLTTGSGNYQMAPHTRRLHASTALTQNKPGMPRKKAQY